MLETMISLEDRYKIYTDKMRNETLRIWYLYSKWDISSSKNFSIKEYEGFYNKIKDTFTYAACDFIYDFFKPVVFNRNFITSDSDINEDWNKRILCDVDFIAENLESVFHDNVLDIDKYKEYGCDWTQRYSSKIDSYICKHDLYSTNKYGGANIKIYAIRDEDRNLDPRLLFRHNYYI